MKRMNEVTSEQRREAFALAKQEIGVGNIPDDQLTPMAVFLMAAIAGQVVSMIVDRDERADRAITSGDPVELVT